MISQWNKFDIYVGTAFEDRPAVVAPPFTPIALINGLGYLLPAPDQDLQEEGGAIDLALALDEMLLFNLDMDVYYKNIGPKLPLK